MTLGWWLISFEEKKHGYYPDFSISKLYGDGIALSSQKSGFKISKNPSRGEKNIFHFTSLKPQQRGGEDLKTPAEWRRELLKTPAGRRQELLKTPAGEGGGNNWNLEIFSKCLITPAGRCRWRKLKQMILFSKSLITPAGEDGCWWAIEIMGKIGIGLNIFLKSF